MNTKQTHRMEVLMTRPNSERPRTARRMTKLCSSLVLGASMLFATNVGASGVPVFDGANWFENMWSKIQSGAEFAKDELRWAEQLKRYTDALVTISGTINNFGLPAGAPLTTVPDDYMVAETCGAADLSLTGLFKRFVYQPEGDWKAQQQTICSRIRVIRNRKYNESIEFAGGTMAQMQAALDRINKLRTASNLLGNVTAADSESLRTANDIAVKTREWETRMKAYDAFISVEEENLKVIAMGALKGKSNRLARDLVKTAALKTALSIK